MSRWFTYGEFVKSAKADRLGIDNVPVDETIQDNIIELMRVLDGVREGWTVKCKENYWGNAAIVVNSGYRCDALNKALGGSDTSAHRIGSAADIEPVNGRNREFLRFVEQYLLDNHIAFDQLISEKPVNGVPSWIHLGLKNCDGKQRRMVFTIK